MVFVCSLLLTSRRLYVHSGGHIASSSVVEAHNARGPHYLLPCSRLQLPIVLATGLPLATHCYFQDLSSFTLYSSPFAPEAPRRAASH